MTNLVERFARDESGATAIEYGLIAAGISVAIITVVNTLGSQLKSTFTNISSQLATAGKRNRPVEQRAPAASPGLFVFAAESALHTGPTTSEQPAGRSACAAPLS